MNKINLALFFTSILFASVFARAQQSATSELKEKTFVFPNQADKKKVMGTLKLEETSSHIVALFETEGLKKGRYYIAKIKNCKTGALAKYDPSLDLLSFETVSGDSSTEKNLTETKIAELLAEDFHLALVNGDKKGGKILSCAAEKTN